MAFQKSWNKDHEVRLMGKRERAKEKEQEIKVERDRERPGNRKKESGTRMGRG